MSDTQAAMREFRFLDDKRKGGGLAPLEEQRWIELGGQLGMSAQQGYYGQDGAWYAYPPGYDPNTGQYYGQQPQYPGYAPPPQQYYDPNAPYYPPQQGYDPNAGYYDPNAPYDPNQQQQQGWDPNAQPSYDPQAQQAPWAPTPQWSEPSHPQQQGEWPQNYDPNTGQYFDPGYAQPAPSRPQYVPAAPSEPQYAPPAPQQWQPPVAEAPAPLAAAEEDGPLEVGEDEVMEVTDDDVTLLDSSPPLATPMPAEPAPHRSFDAEKPLTAAPQAADLFGDLRSSLSLDEQATPLAPALAEVEPLLEASVEPDLQIPVDLAPASVPTGVVAQPQLDIATTGAAEPAPRFDSPAPVAAFAPTLDIAEVAASEPDFQAPPVAAFEPILDIPEVGAAELDIPVPLAASEPKLEIAEAADEPALPAAITSPVMPALEPWAFDARPSDPDVSKVEPPPGDEVSFEPEIDEEPPAVAEMPSIMVANDLGAESFAAPAPRQTMDAALELPPISALSAMLGRAPQPPPQPEAPLVLTNVAPVSATEKDLYPSGPPPLAVPAAPPPPVSFELSPPSEPIPDPRPSIPISIQVEEPVEAGTFDVEPFLEASVEAEPAPFMPPPSFEASFDDLPVAHEPEPPRSNHTGFEASLGDLPPAIANEPPPPIIDVLTAMPAEVPAMLDFDVALDDKPLPEEAPMDLDGSADDKVELAKTSDFLEFPRTATDEAASFSTDEGESLVESGTLATMANPAQPVEASRPEPIELPPDEPDTGVPLATNADFLGMSELTNTGQAWTKRDDTVTFTEQPVEEDIIQGVALEDDAIDAEITAELAEAVIEPEPWPAQPPPPPAYVPSPPMAPVAAAPRPAAPAFVPSPPAVRAPAPFVPSPAPRPVSSAPFDAGPDRSMFETKGTLLREDSAPVITGEHRVILHTVEGQVKRGVLRDTRLSDDVVGLEAQPGAVEKIPRPRIKAIFFMLPAGQKAPTPKGDKLRVTFKDGRQLAGFSIDHRGSGIGFFVVPADNRTNTERIFIYRSSVEKVAVD